MITHFTGIGMGFFTAATLLASPAVAAGSIEECRATNIADVEPFNDSESLGGGESPATTSRRVSVKDGVLRVARLDGGVGWEWETSVEFFRLHLAGIDDCGIKTYEGVGRIASFGDNHTGNYSVPVNRVLLEDARDYSCVGNKPNFLIRGLLANGTFILKPRLSDYVNPFRSTFTPKEPTEPLFRPLAADKVCASTLDDISRTVSIEDFASGESGGTVVRKVQLRLVRNIATLDNRIRYRLTLGEIRDCNVRVYEGVGRLVNSPDVVVDHMEIVDSTGFNCETAGPVFKGLDINSGDASVLTRIDASDRL